ncbi:hypothetical protein NKH33_27105, partial [Mesorhizobium sp. M1182]|uniref:hypothetical protein n=1 Tax=Mesorhizobium sp. M1182 TaxID=2957067 RepID=UPI00333A4650
GEEVASTLIKTLRCEWIHGFIADFFNTIHLKQTFGSQLAPATRLSPQHFNGRPYRPAGGASRKLALATYHLSKCHGCMLRDSKHQTD